MVGRRDERWTAQDKDGYSVDEGFLSNGRKEDDGADKSAANLTRPFRFVGLWLSRGWSVVVGWLEEGFACPSPTSG